MERRKKAINYAIIITLKRSKIVILKFITSLSLVSAMSCQSILAHESPHYFITLPHFIINSNAKIIPGSIIPEAVLPLIHLQTAADRLLREFRLPLKTDEDGRMVATCHRIHHLA